MTVDILICGATVFDGGVVRPWKPMWQSRAAESLPSDGTSGPLRQLDEAPRASRGCCTFWPPSME